MHLEAVAGSHTEDELAFCSYCGRSDSETERVCSHCGLGVRLRTSSDVVLAPDAAFLVVRDDGRVSAVSAGAERMLGRHMVGRQMASIDLRGMEWTSAPCGDPPATLVVLAVA